MAASIILDILMLGILLGCALYYRHKGFLASIVTFLGTLAALLIALFAAQRLAPAFFETLFRERMIEATSEAIVQHGADSLLGVLNQVVGFLPEAARESVAASAAGSFEGLSASMATTVVDNVIAPLIVPMLSMVLFLLIFLGLRLVVGLISKLMYSVRRVPVVGGANRFLGLILGLLVGALYVFLILCIIWAMDAVYGGSGFGAQYFGSSLTYTLAKGHNPFLG